MSVFIGGTLPIGAIVHAHLTEAQFQTQAGSGWILADGRNVAGSAYASITGSSTVPDIRGVGLRGKNNGRSDGKENTYGDHALGTYEYDNPGKHYHRWLTFTLYDSGNKYRQQTYTTQNTIQDFQPSATATNDTQNRGYIATQSDVGTLANQLRGYITDHGYTSYGLGGAGASVIDETSGNRPDSETTIRTVTENVFIRIN